MFLCGFLFMTDYMEEKKINGTLLVISFVYLSVLSLFANATGHISIALLLAPLLFFLIKFDAFNFIVVYFSCNLFFFDPYKSSAFFNVLNVTVSLQIADAFLIVFLAGCFFSKKNLFSFAFPRSGLLFTFYLFIAYVLIMAINPLLAKGGDLWLVYDIKIFLVFALVAFFCTQPLYTPKKIIYIFFAVILFADLYALIVIGKFLFAKERQITWNEIYFSNMTIVSIVLFTAMRNKFCKVMLAVAIFISVFGILASQTRSIWISTFLCSMAYLVCFFIRKLKNIDVGKVTKFIIIMALSLLAVEIIMRVFLKTDLLYYLTKRMTITDNTELINPFSSLGYRIYESTSVWLKRSFWGHGTGAYLYLFQPLLGQMKFLYWQSIHCEYMEILHKWGFFGIGLYFVFIATYLFQSFKLFISKKKFVSLLGAIAFLTFSNTLIISVTSGYMFRVNMLMWVNLMIGVIVNYRTRLLKNKHRLHS
jgi:hypothetical protein